MSTSQGLPRLAVTPGEPAGIGPELTVRLASTPLAADLVALADPDLLQRTARRCKLPLHLQTDDGQRIAQRQAGHLRIIELPMQAEEVPGQLDPRNALYVLNSLARAADACLQGNFDALLTGPVHKGVINDAGEPFSGHTGLFATRAGVAVVMMLMSGQLRVALATTHLPLAKVPAVITTQNLERTLCIVTAELKAKFAIQQPRIAVLGLNPHAGEGGHMGREEIDIIEPLLARLREQGMQLLGPLPADTAFIPDMRQHYDAVLAMYHDQALPVLKAEAFDSAINITLGLPFIRTSVDHGTALDLAGHNRASPASMLAAARQALVLAKRQ